MSFTLVSLCIVLLAVWAVTIVKMVRLGSEVRSLHARVEALEKDAGGRTKVLPDSAAPTITPRAAGGLAALRPGETADIEGMGRLLYKGRDESGAYCFESEDAKLQTLTAEELAPRLQRIIDRQGVRKWPRSWD